MQRPVRVSRRTRDRRRKRSRPSLPIGPLAVRWRLLRLEPLEDRTLLDAFGTGLVEPSEDDLAWAQSNLTVVESVSLNSLARQRVREEQNPFVGPSPRAENTALALGSEVVGRTEAEIEGSSDGEAAVSTAGIALQTLPTAVDNSTLPYFPPIRSQGDLGSCAAFCTTYYTMTYMTAMARGWDVRNDADNTNKFSPKWTYNLINGGSDNGAWLTDALQVLSTNGSATWAEFPYDTNCTEWVYDAPAVWRDAIGYRTDAMGSVYDVDTAVGLENVKTLLADGYILNYATYIHSWQYKTIGDDPSTTADNAYVGRQCAYWVNGTSGPHGMTVVGYNDNIWVDINGNGAVDSGEKGAFRIANSWGTSWMESGFTWLAYDALKATSAVVGGPSANRQVAWWYKTAYWMTARESYTPTLLAEFSVQHAKRNQLRINLGIADTGDLPTSTWQPAALAQSGGELGFDGLYHAYDPASAPVGTFVFDFTDLVPYLGAEHTYFLGLNDVSDSSLGGTLSSFRLTDAAGNVLATCRTGTEPGNVPQTDNDTFSTVAYVHLSTPASPIIIDGAPVSVPEGSSATFQLKLAESPATPVTVVVAWASGDSTISITSGSTLLFDSNNWDVYQTVTLSAAEDVNRTNGTALITCSAPTLATTITVTALAIDNDHRTYYVNDASTGFDEWCSASGSDINDGLSPATPKATVQAILDAYTLTAGDTVRIDTGTYLLTENILVTSADSGDATAPVTFEASPYGVVMDRGGGYIAHIGWQITGPYVTVTTATSNKYPAAPQAFQKVTNGIVGFYITASNVSVSRCESSDNSANGFEIRGASVQGVTLENTLVYGNRTDGVKLYLTSGVRLNNCTIRVDLSDSGDHYAVNLGTAQNFSLTNSIISVHNGTNVRAWFANGATWSSDYNDFWATGGAVIADVPAAGRLGEWRDFTGQDAHSLSVDPQFVNPAAGDFHLESTAGSYHGGAWTTDALDSCGLDAAWGDAESEPKPSTTPGRAMGEGCRNLGAYGGTEQASKTPGSPSLGLVSPSTSQIIRGSTQAVRWTWIGAGARPDDTVKIEYSSNGGASWRVVPGAEALPWALETFAWDVGSQPTAAQYRIRVTSNVDPSVTSQSGSFQIRHGGAITYYLNDNSDDYDLWCTALGSPANDGASPATPKRDLDDLLSTCNIEPGDAILLDTGAYSPDDYYSTQLGDTGDVTGRVTVLASPYGVIVDFSDSWGWDVGDYVTLDLADSQRYPTMPKYALKIRGGYGTLRASGQAARVSGCDVSSSEYAGIIAANTSIIENCVVWGNSGAGVAAYYRTTIRNCTIFDNTENGIYVASGATPALEDNIIWADGPGRTAVYVVGSSLPTSSNYNDLYATAGAAVGYYGTSCATLAAWQTATGKDSASISVDPRLANLATGDAHLLSTGGRYDPSRGRPPEDPAAWVIDPSRSPCIDAGNPAAACFNELRPNGGRVNIGAYGNTAQASRSYLNSAPVLDNSGTMLLLPINQGAVNNPGTLVQDILASAGGDRITDADPADPEGIAVTAVANTHGRWQYKLGSDGTWTDFGAPSETAARLLPADASTWVRFVPELNWTGTLDPGITFRAWDQTGGLPGGTADTTTNGGVSPFSTATETASITVNPFYTLDADGNGAADALTDGILILRYLFSPPGNWNIDDALDPAATRTTLDALRSYLNNARTGALDVDGNGTADALTDGILILRYLFSPSGEWESSDAVGVGATRTSRASIQAFLDLYNPNVVAASAAAFTIAPSISGTASEGLSSSPGNEREDRRSDGSAILCLSPDRVVRSTATDAALEADLSVLDSPPAEFAIQATGLWFKEQAEGAEQYLAPPNAASRAPVAFERRALDAIHQQSTMSSAASHLETVRTAAWARCWHSDSADEDLFDVDLAGHNSWWSNRNQRGQVPGRSVRHTSSTHRLFSR
jgi:parallel beta-helix repeat protein